MAINPLPLIFSPRTRNRLVVVRVCVGGISALRELVRDCRGVIAVQFAILVGPMLLLLLGTFDIGLGTLTDTRINFAVEAAAKCGAIGAATCSSPSETAAYGASIAGLPGLDASSFLVTTAACGLNVTVTYPYSGLVLPTITLNASACYPTG